MKVYVMTESVLFGRENYIGVKSSFKEAEKALREVAPHMRKTDSSRTGTTAYSSDVTPTSKFFIHEEETDA